MAKIQQSSVNAGRLGRNVGKYIMLLPYIFYVVGFLIFCNWSTIIFYIAITLINLLVIGCKNYVNHQNPWEGVLLFIGVQSLLTTIWMIVLSSILDPSIVPFFKPIADIINNETQLSGSMVITFPLFLANYFLSYLNLFFNCFAGNTMMVLLAGVWKMVSFIPEKIGEWIGKCIGKYSAQYKYAPEARKAEGQKSQSIYNAESLQRLSTSAYLQKNLSMPLADPRIRRPIIDPDTILAIDDDLDEWVDSSIYREASSLNSEIANRHDKPSFLPSKLRR